MHQVTVVHHVFICSRAPINLKDTEMLSNNFGYMSGDIDLLLT